MKIGPSTAASLILMQIRNAKRDKKHKPLYLETSQEVYESLRQFIVEKSKCGSLHECYVMFFGVEVFPIKQDSTPNLGG